MRVASCHHCVFHAAEVTRAAMLKPVSRPPCEQRSPAEVASRTLGFRLGAVLAATLALLAPGCAKEDAPAPAPEKETAIASSSEALTSQSKVTLVAARDTSIRSTDPNTN